MTELIRHTGEFIKGKAYGSVVLSDIKDEIGHVIDVTPNYHLQDRRRIMEQNARERSVSSSSQDDAKHLVLLRAIFRV